MIAESGFR